MSGFRLLRLLRKDVFIAVGNLIESVKNLSEYQIALRLINKDQVRLVREFLYFTRNLEKCY